LCGDVHVDEESYCNDNSINPFESWMSQSMIQNGGQHTHEEE